MGGTAEAYSRGRLSSNPGACCPIIAAFGTLQSGSTCMKELVVISGKGGDGQLLSSPLCILGLGAGSSSATVDAQICTWFSSRISAPRRLHGRQQGPHHARGIAQPRQMRRAVPVRMRSTRRAGNGNVPKRSASLRSPAKERRCFDLCDEEGDRVRAAGWGGAVFIRNAVWAHGSFQARRGGIEKAGKLVNICGARPRAAARSNAY